MFAQINHIAIISRHISTLGRFYESAFNLSPPSERRPLNGVTIGDGYAGININSRRAGSVSALDHFGFLVDDVPAVLERMQSQYPQTGLVKRPSSRPFAAYSGHDPDGNVFDLAQKNNDNRSSIYKEQAEEAGKQDRYINKFAIRTVNPDQVARFYREVFELETLNRKTEAPGHHLTDGRVTLSILPWTIDLCENMSIKRPGPDHLGFKVENIDALKKDLLRIAARNPAMAPIQLGGTEETDACAELFRKSALGSFQIADSDGNWIDISVD
jgi:catechol 2,3-dioxygenase-like lactoylglutathione lyase family enzyme